MSKRFKVKIDSEDDPKDQDALNQTAEEIAGIVSEDVTAGADIERLRSELETAKRAVEEEHDRYLRALADFANYRRRHQEDYAAQMQFANRELLIKLLPIVDNFERALQASQENENFQSLSEGVSLTLRQLQEMLEKEDVKPIEAVGREFDPNLHEAVMRMESDEYPDNTVVEELEKGYTQGDRVIRPARVKVAVR